MRKPAPQGGPLLLLSCGGYRSGSTYCYNLLGEYVEQANLGRRVGYLEPDQAPLLEQLWSVVEALGAPVGKSHNAPGVTAGADAWERLQAAGRLLPVCTVRDWREVLVSFCRKFRETPEQVLAGRRWELNLRNLAGWRERGAVEVRYEQLVGAPLETLQLLTGAARLPYDAGAARAALVAASLASAAAVTAALAEGDVHARTLLHSDHLTGPARPEGDTWQEWTRDWDPGRLARVGAALDPLMSRDGYAWEPPATR